MAEHRNLPIVQASNGGSRFRLRVKPKARRDAIVGTYDDSLKVAVKAAPEAGHANHAVCVLLARLLAVDVAAVKIVAGEGSRNKTVLIEGLSPDECIRRLRLHLG